MPWLRNEKLQRMGGGLGERMSVGVIAKVQLFALGAHKDKAIVDLIRQVRKKRKVLITAYEAFILFSLARAQSRYDAEMAEVGVFQGGSTRMICEGKGDRTLHLFDTFEGLPESHEIDKRTDRQDYACSLDSVKEYLKDQPNLVFHKGLFPDTGVDVEGSRFSFVNLDMDLYEGTLAGLRFFYPRLVPGGILISHDYSILPGVRAAFEEFLADKPEPAIEMPSSQCMIVKLGV